MLIVLCIHLTVFAQNRQISLRLFSFSNYQFSSSIENTGAMEANNGYFNAFPMLGYQHFCKNNVIYSVEYGFTRMKNKSNSTSQESSSEMNKFNSLSKSATQAIRLGIGKRNVWNRLVLSSMLYVPFQYTYNSMYERTQNVFNHATNLWNYAYQKEQQPNMLTTGLYLAQGLDYPISKQFLVGIELNLGLRKQIQKGDHSQKTIYDDGMSLIETEQNSNYARTYSSLDFLPTLSIKYQFGKR